MIKVKSKKQKVKKKDNILRKMFGKHKFSKPTDQLMKEMDEELYND